MAWLRWTQLIVRAGRRSPILGGLLAALTFNVPFAVIGLFILPTWQLWLAVHGGLLLLLWPLTTLNALRDNRRGEEAT